MRGPGPQPRRAGQGHPGGGDESLARSAWRPLRIDRHRHVSIGPVPVSSSPFYLTTAIDYVNGQPHLGTAYEKITADVIARYKRLCGVETHFLMGNDEHSQNVYRKAREQGLDPLVYCDQMEQPSSASVWARLDISFDDFIRTTEPRHQRRRAGDDASRSAPTATSTRATTRAGTACRARRSSRRRTWSTACARSTRRKPEWIRETNYFFRLSAYRDRLLAHFAAHPGVPAAGRAPQRDPAPARRPASRTSRSAAPGSRGASRCRSIRRASSTCGSTR